jgi:hypothetical protein
MTTKPQDGEYSPAEIQRRMDNAVRRALNTKPKIQADYVGKNRKQRLRSSKSDNNPGDNESGN